MFQRIASWFQRQEPKRRRNLIIVFAVLLIAVIAGTIGLFIPDSEPTAKNTAPSTSDTDTAEHEDATAEQVDELTGGLSLPIGEQAAPLVSATAALLFNQATADGVTDLQIKEVIDTASYYSADAPPASEIVPLIWWDGTLASPSSQLSFYTKHSAVRSWTETSKPVKVSKAKAAAVAGESVVEDPDVQVWQVAGQTHLVLFSEVDPTQQLIEKTSKYLLTVVVKQVDGVFLLVNILPPTHR